VTTDLAAPRRANWRPRLIWLILALSLALNLFFVAGGFWVRMGAGHGMMNPAERQEAVAKDLALDADQRAAFDHFIRTMRVRTRQLRENNQLLFDDAWQELAKPNADDAAIDKIVEEASNNRHAYQLEMSHAMRAFLRELNDQQRTTFIEIAKNRENRNGPPLLRQLLQ